MIEQDTLDRIVKKQKELIRKNKDLLNMGNKYLHTINCSMLKGINYAMEKIYKYGRIKNVKEQRKRKFKP